MANPTQSSGPGDANSNSADDSSSSHNLNHLLRTGRGLVLDLKLSFL
jgi:hypothetical protein